MPSFYSIRYIHGFRENSLSQEMTSFHNRNTLHLYPQHEAILLISQDHANDTLTLGYLKPSFGCLMHSNNNALGFEPWQILPCSPYFKVQGDEYILHHYQHIS